MRRIRNWDVALVRWQDRMLGEPWEWGRTDCGSLVWSALEAMYDSPPVGAVPAYGNEREAVKTWKRTGGVAQVLMENGAETVDLNFAQQGDVLVIEENDPLPGAYVLVERFAVGSDPEGGVQRVPLREIRRRAEELNIQVVRPPVE